MRIVIDLQGAQSESRFRGIGRYSLALALGVARNAGEHEVWLVLNGALGGAIAELRRAFAGLVPPERIRVFDIVGPVAEIDEGNSARCRAAELMREYFIARLQPDAVLVTSLFEGFVDDAVVSVGAFDGAERTAVVLYDLIPFLNPAAYLGSQTQRTYYERKIASLRKAGLLLSISDYSRQEAIDALGLAPGSVTAISTAVDDSFRPSDSTPEQLAEQTAELRARFGITRQMLMYAPGGFDARKNIDGLITAYCLLPPALRDAHQLLIASKMGERERAELVAHAAKRGLEKDQLILTGYVSDADLIRLYQAAALFIFPSRHEGFGLPALEAMACGALVIGANNTSIPEVVGCAEALFDADRPQSIAEKIAQVLQDPAMQERLRVHGRAQAARFSWDASATKALRALEARFGDVPAPVVPLPAKRPRLAFVSPLPPERTGIADYAAQVLPAMMEHYDIELIVQQDKVVLPPSLAALPRRSAAWFDQNAGQFDRILYQFGNSPFHSHMFGLLARHPGVVVLHDFFISSVLAYEQMNGAIPNGWTDALYEGHGMAALLAGLDPARALDARNQYPCNLAVLRQARRVVVHSQHARELARQWYGPLAAGDWSVVPLPRSLPQAEDRASARRALGIADDVFLVCSFGFVAHTKHSQELLDAWIGSTLHANPRCELVLVGANDGGEYGVTINATLAGAGGKRMRIAGWTDEAVYHQYLQAADVGVQLRCQSRGETSAAVLDCLNYGLATIVNANGSMAELPPDAVWGLPDQFSMAQLRDALEGLHADPARRTALGERARTLLHTVHSPAHSARLYAEALESTYAPAAGARGALLAALADQPSLHADDALVRRSAQCLAALPEALAPRQLLVDVTSIARHDLKTGIERVVRMQLIELLARVEPGLRIEPVYLADQDGRCEYRYARDYARRLFGIDCPLPPDQAVDVQAGDRFYSADYAPGAIMAAARKGVYAHWRARGVEVNFLIHDLLPVLRPEFFPEGADHGHAAWLACIAGQADRLVCISDAVRNELQAWLEHTRPEVHGQVKLAVLHHGADIGGAQAIPAPAAARVAAVTGGPATFLMVGTIEPRKGHLQALDAFEQLWREGVDANLVIVGAEGWTPLPDGARRTIPRIVERLRGHPQLGQRLQWLKGIGDAELLDLYQNSSCLLVPSEGEGFGLPLIEAARYGLPVLARDIPVFREVAGEHAAYFSGMDGADLAAALREWLEQHGTGTAPASSGMPWITWRENAAQLLDVLAGRRQEVRWPAA
ncbi:glycosyltransferase [Massilia antarctica]|uniref:glycosyltransferase n=1 Tax=Massilia antarctica TaxID=2765360 RepID=UPI0006BB7715|nr:glycosyltransferase [Massilia sp. H27-R4]MCY0911059.1 glycosyltransferase [Massilia sp. H27-R4]CUI05364.1 Mannosyltransferase [Janthinobacterium sp. CG23_2]CUU29150.1 Mannosyltransferase [Janthinobacterium sp. CG23_2]